MARKKFICDPTSVYHITSRTKNKEPFLIDMDQAWLMFSDQLYFLHHGFELEILSFVLMNNHFHLMAMAPKANMSKAMQYFMQSTSREINSVTGSINQVWGGRYFRCRLNTYYYLMNCYKYVYQNPLRANICDRVEDYAYSSLRGVLGLERHIIPTTLESQIFDKGVEHTLHWLNTKTSDEALYQIRKALRQRQFKLQKVNGYLSQWEESLI